MIIYYKLETKEINRTEDNTMIPVLPFNKTFDEKVVFYKEKGLGFIAIPQELGRYVWGYTLNFDSEGNFVGLSPKEVQDGE